MKIHSDSPSSKGHTFDLQSQALLPTLLARQCDATPSTHHSMPGQSRPPLQRPYGQACRTREACDFRHFAIGNHLPARNASDYTS